MKRPVITLPVLLFYACTAFCQSNKTDGLLIYTLGKDTTMIGNYKLTGEHFEMTVLSREYAIVYEQKGSFDTNGELKTVEGVSYRVEYNKPSQDKRFYRLYVKDDSTHTEIKTEEGSYKNVYKGRGVVNNLIGHTTFFLLAFWPHFSPPVGDSIVSQHMWWDRPKRYIIERTAQNKMRVGSTLIGFLTMYLSDKGTLKSIDGLGSSLNLIGHVLPYRDMDSIIKAFTIHEHVAGKIGTNNKPDSVVTTVNSTNIQLYYNRPSMRGRQIFGNVVPYNRFWRTGANEATVIKIDKSIYIDGKELPAGAYSVFTVPRVDGWTLMFNKKIDIWGTEYDPGHDVLRVPMTVEDVAEPTELMTIEIVPVDGGGLFTIKWERKKASVFFVAMSKGTQK